MSEQATETAHLRSDYYGPKVSEVTACGITLPAPDVFAHPEDVDCRDCLRTFLAARFGASGGGASANDCYRCRTDLGYECSPGAIPPVVKCPGEECASCDYAAAEVVTPPGASS